ncbi:hypothetical protein HS088_TW14G01118 [Tripterygium wilfordii]|uniref:Uncharacterized protein n=1 Tax=Tripterygium wilfordii TaxID=458696 RepID=A0A7J7CS88_TRIWF|nr:hypothetical protein HS088_TW14G01118 [Tripterygium wilfordii]
MPFQQFLLGSPNEIKATDFCLINIKSKLQNLVPLHRSSFHINIKSKRSHFFFVLASACVVARGREEISSLEDEKRSQVLLECHCLGLPRQCCRSSVSTPELRSSQDMLLEEEVPLPWSYSFII